MVDLEKAVAEGKDAPASVLAVSGGEEQESLISADLRVELQAAVEVPESALLQQASEVTEDQAPVGTTHRVSFLRTRVNTEPAPTELKAYLTHSFLIITVATGTLINLFFIRSAKEPLSENPSLIVACASAFMSLISSFGLAINTMKQMTVLLPLLPRHLVRDSPCSWSKLFLCLSTASMAFTVISIIVSFLPKAYYYLPVVLMPTLLVLGVSFYDGRPRRNHVVTLGDDDPHKDERERSFQLTVNMSGFSFAGALGTIIGYHKKLSNSAGYVDARVSIYLMLGAFITSLLVLLLSRLRRQDLKKAAVGNAIVLCPLVLAVFIIAFTFLGGLLAGTLFPVAVAAAIWYFFEYHVPRGDLLDAAFSREEELKLLYSGALTAMSLSFGAVMTTFAGFLGGQAKGCSLEMFMFFVVSCFVSSVTQGVIAFRAPKKASLGAAARVLAYVTLVLLVLAGLAMVSYVG